MKQELDSLISQWTRVGVLFNCAPADRTPDLERMLLDTARLSPGMSRLFIMAATWLSRYGELIAKHRLIRLIRDELDRSHEPVLGALLDIAQAGSHPKQFATVIRHLRPAPEAKPLFEINAGYPSAARRGERDASDEAKRWNLWFAPIELKDDALRPAAWLMRHNEEFRHRAFCRGDGRASVYAALRHDPDAGRSELQLARTAGLSRAQLRNNLANMELLQIVTREPGGHATKVRLSAA